MSSSEKINFILVSLFLLFLYSCSKDKDDPVNNPDSNTIVEITGFTPQKGTKDTEVTINGKNFATTVIENTVKFNGTTATLTSASATQLKVNVPEGATTGPITLKVGQFPLVTSDTDFMVIHPPIISSFSPDSGLTGTEVTIQGQNFSEVTGDNKVRFGNILVTEFITTSTTKLVVKVPEMAVTGKISVTVNELTAESTDNFTVIGSPNIIQVSPNQGIVGDVVNITMENAGINPEDNEVRFNGVLAKVDAVDGNVITTAVPEGATTGKVTVEVNGQIAESDVDFTVTYPFKTELDKLLAEGGIAGDIFGHSVDIDGDYAIVGGPSEEGSNIGTVLIFKRNGESWSVHKKLTVDEVIPDDGFGSSVAIDGDYAVVGAPGVDANTGAIYVFDGTQNWSQVQKLTANDKEIDDFFGYSVDISGNYIITGAMRDDVFGSNEGSAYIFEENGGNWSQIKKLYGNLNETDLFGYSVAIDGDYAVVGAQLDDENGFNSGVAFIFDRNQNWAEIKKLAANDGTNTDFFGTAVAIDGTYVIVGAPGHDHGDMLVNDGAAYVFENQGGNWFQINKLTAQDGVSNDEFGSAVAISGSYIIVGAPKKDELGNNSGVFYAFKVNEGSWNQISKVSPNDSQEGDAFGTAVALDGDYAIIGAMNDDDQGQNSGSAYIFKK
ncbi:IPT/TIG domain-containing protein [Flagellimonas nanhaiensis]|nr:IPT/TIG domain-containing protein [Allomuricauda nanhaiensis]